MVAQHNVLEHGTMLGQELLHHLLRSLMKYVGKPGQRISLSADPKELIQLLTSMLQF